MRRSAQVTQAMSARRRARAASDARPESAAIKFLVSEDNGGGFRWSIVDVDGQSLAESVRFASGEEARRAARFALGSAASAPFDGRAGGAAPIDLAARRDAAIVRQDRDRERWSASASSG